jgi:hypothetical protein
MYNKPIHMKICNKCKINRPLSSFNKDNSRADGLSYKCISCYKQDNLKRYEIKKDQIKSNSKKWNQNNKGKNRASWEKYYSENKNKIIQRSKDWREENKEQYNLYQKQYREKNKILHNLRVRLNISLKKYLKENKKYNTEEYLGCSIEEYIVYLEKQFNENMTWENYGTYWEIDHTIPLSKGGSFHYTNTTPMTISENRSKSNKI